MSFVKKHQFLIPWLLVYSSYFNYSVCQTTAQQNLQTSIIMNYQQSLEDINKSFHNFLLHGVHNSPKDPLHPIGLDGFRVLHSPLQLPSHHSFGVNPLMLYQNIPPLIPPIITQHRLAPQAFQFPIPTTRIPITTTLFEIINTATTTNAVEPITTLPSKITTDTSIPYQETTILPNLLNTNSSIELDVRKDVVQQTNIPLVLNNIEDLRFETTLQSDKFLASFDVLNSTSSNIRRFEAYSLNISKIQSLPDVSSTENTLRTTSSLIKLESNKSTLLNKIIKPSTTSKYIQILEKPTPMPEFIKEKNSHLEKHLNSTSLKSFLQSSNLSKHEVQIFLHLMEKVLEEEVAKRLEKHSENKQLQNEVVVTGKQYSKSNENKGVEPLPEEDWLDALEDHELKTVNTRLSYNNREDSGNSSTKQSKISSVIPLNEKVTIQQKRIHGVKFALSPDLNYFERSHLKTNTITLNSSQTIEGIKEIKKTSEADVPLSDYKSTEQFDKLVKKLAAETQINKVPVIDLTKSRYDNSDLLNVYSPTASKIVEHTQNPILSLNGRIFSKIPNRHEPKTKFEHLVEDYKYRLSGNNGIDDLLKALQNANIGFFERNIPKYNG